MQIKLTEAQEELVLEALYALHKIKEEAAQAVADEAERTGNAGLKRLNRDAFGIPKIEAVIAIFEVEA